MAITEIICKDCGKRFPRQRNKAREAVKLGHNQYCSPECQFNARLKGEHQICQNCGTNIWRTPKDFKKSSTKRFFCTRSCAAIFNNRLRSEALPKNFCKHPTCDKTIPRRQLYCSRKCATYSRERTPESLKNEVLGKIRDFNILNRRIPTKKEMYSAYGKARDVFGTWNKAIESAGYKPNPVMFANRFLARDGHWCDSLAEKIIDEWFYSKKIAHERSVPYPEFKRMTCDFIVGKYYIEFFGLEGEHREYTRQVQKKRRLAKKYNLKLIEIKPIHIFPKNQLDRVLSFLT